jgi:hypothetical protein
LVNHVQYVVFVIHQIFSTDKIYESQRMFSANHQKIKDTRFFIFTKCDDAIACYWKTTIIKCMTFFSTIITIYIFIHSCVY